MRIECPQCGLRDRREFYYQGAAVSLTRPSPEEDPEVWDAYVHLRDNPAGWGCELWYHDAGCGAWLVVERHMSSHEIRSVQFAEGAS
ncbi:MAG: sarcosine oxidase subunit delta [Paracoccaceae bacterium]